MSLERYRHYSHAGLVALVCDRDTDIAALRAELQSARRTIDAKDALLDHKTNERVTLERQIERLGEMLKDANHIARAFQALSPLRRAWSAFRGEF